MVNSFSEICYNVARGSLLAFLVGNVGCGMQ